MKMFSLLSAMLILLSIDVQVFAQAKGNYQAVTSAYAISSNNQKTTVNVRKNSLVIDVKALMNKQADSYLAIFNLVQLGPTAQEVDALLNARYQGFFDEAVAAGIPAENITTDMISFLPIYAYEEEKKLFSKNYNEIPTGFELQKNIHVRYDSPKQLDILVSAAAKNEIYDLVKTEYFVEDTEAIYDELRKAAVKLMNEKVADYAKMGIVLDTVYRMLDDARGAIFPASRYQKYNAYVQSSVQAFKKKSTLNEIRKPNTFFYNKIPYEDYDIVLNASMLEPCVQYTYHLQMHFFLEDNYRTITKREKEYLLITPDATIERLRF
jgi:uncharacterized protein YggE